MSPQATVRAQARDALKHKYPKALTALVTALLPVCLIDYAAAALLNTALVFGSDYSDFNLVNNVVVYPLTLIAGVLLSPFLNGYIRIYYRNALTGEMDLNDLFYYFEGGRYGNALALNLSLMLRLILPAALCYLPVVAYIVICAKLDNGFYGSVLFGDFYFILWILSALLLTLYALRYFTVYALHIEYEQMSIKELFGASSRIMQGRTSAAAKLVLSYTPWMLLCITVLPLLYVVPYMTQGLCIGAKWMTRAAYEENQ